MILNTNDILNLNIKLTYLSLPIGISFYTFQTMSYTIDVYRGKVKVQKNILTLATYVSMFPQLIAGPIVRYETIEDELINRKSSWNNVNDGFTRFVIGLSKKVLIANQMAIIADEIFALPNSSRGMLLAWTGIIAYSFQIYYDFSGYSDMAIGLGKIFGFIFLENFNYPYISKSVTEFWRRWHISLGTWFKDYLYIPLGGNKTSKLKWLRNVAVVWGLTGLWHGASWNFVLWGAYYGVVLVIEKLLLSKLLFRTPKVFQRIYTLLAVMVGWVIFRIESVSGIKEYIKSMIGFNGSGSFIELYDLNLAYLFPFFIVAMIGSTPFPAKVLNKCNNTFVEWVRGFLLITILLLSMLFLVNDSYNPFIYYRF